MRIILKVPIKCFVLIYLLGFFFCIESCYAQRANTNATKITIAGKSREDGKVLFSNGREIKLGNFYTSISPDSQKIAILYFASNYDSTTNLEIYTSSGQLSHKYKVEALGRVILANDGRFIIHGAYPSERPSSDYIMRFYGKDGKMIKSPSRTFGEVVGTFTKDGSLIILTEKRLMWHYSNENVELFLFSNTFEQKYYKELSDWPKYSSLAPPVYDDKKELIKIYTYNGNIDTGKIKKEIIILDKNLTFKERKTQWDY